MTGTQSKMKLHAVSLAFIILILSLGCLGEGGGEEHVHTNLASAIEEMDPQACDNTSHYELDKASETNTTAATVITTILPSLTTTTLHPSQSGPSGGKKVPTRFNAVVYKSKADCRCCDQYFNYFEAYGFELEIIEIDDMESLYREYKIPHHMQSCHTIFLEGYFIEGHPPIEAVEKLLSEKPDIDGITLPGTPNGAPGIRGAKTGEFTIYALKDGKASVFLIL